MTLSQSCTCFTSNLTCIITGGGTSSDINIWNYHDMKIKPQVINTTIKILLNYNNIDL